MTQPKIPATIVIHEPEQLEHILRRTVQASHPIKIDFDWQLKKINRDAGLYKSEARVFETFKSGEVAITIEEREEFYSRSRYATKRQTIHLGAAWIYIPVVHPESHGDPMLPSIQATHWVHGMVLKYAHHKETDVGNLSQLVWFDYRDYEIKHEFGVLVMGSSIIQLTHFVAGSEQGMVSWLERVCVDDFTTKAGL